jgi:hypothetical protein
LHEDVCAECARHLTEASAIPGLRDVLTSEGSWQKFLAHARRSQPACSFRCAQAATRLEFLVPLTNCFVCRWFCLVLGPKPPVHHQNWLSFGKFQDTECFLILCPQHVSSRLPPSTATCKYAMEPITQTNFLPTDMLLSAVSVLVVALLSPEVPEGLMNYAPCICQVFLERNERLNSILPF